MMVAAREATSPAATAAPSSCRARRQRLPAGESRPGQHALGEGEPAPGLRGADPQPRPQELRGVPVPVIHRRAPGTRPSGCGRDAPRHRCTSPMAAGCPPSPAGSAAAAPGPQAAVPSGVAAPARGPAGGRPPFRRARRDGLFRVRSTAPAATSCRYSTVRESSSTSPAKSAAARKSQQRRVLHRRRSAQAPGAAPTPDPDQHQAVLVRALACPRTEMESLTASMTKLYQRATTVLAGHRPARFCRPRRPVLSGVRRQRMVRRLAGPAAGQQVRTPGEKSTDSGGPATSMPAARTS